MLSYFLFGDNFILSKDYHLQGQFGIHAIYVIFLDFFLRLFACLFTCVFKCVLKNIDIPRLSSLKTAMHNFQTKILLCNQSPIKHMESKY